MKTLFTFAFLMLASGSIFCQNSNIIFFSEAGFPFYVIVNGVKQNEVAQSNVKVTGLRGEMSYKAKVVFQDNSIPNVDKGFYLEANTEVTVNVKQNKKGEYVMQWMGSVPMGQAPVDNSQYVTVYGSGTGTGGTNTTTTAPNNTTTTVTTQETVTTTTTTNNPTTTTVTSTPNTNSQNVNMNTMGVNTNVNVTETQGTNSESVNMNVDVMGVNMNVNVTATGTGVGTDVNTNTGWTNTTDASVNPNNNTNTNTNWNTNTTNNSTTTTTVTTTTTTTTDGSTANWNTNGSTDNRANNATTGRGCFAISESDFETVKKSIKDKNFADAQLTQAKQITRAKCLTAKQIAAITKDCFGFDETRLEYAIFAYSHCSDPDNYYLVNDSFAFPGSIEDLDKAIHP